VLFKRQGRDNQGTDEGTEQTEEKEGKEETAYLYTGKQKTSNEEEHERS